MNNFTKQYKNYILTLYMNGKSTNEIVNECNVPIHILKRWVKVQQEEFMEKLLSEAVVVDVDKLIHENTRLHKENDILRRALQIIGS